MAILIALAGCAGGSTPQVNNMQSATTSPAMLKKQEASGGPGNLLSLNLGGGQQQTTSIPVNAYLWRASLDTLSFMPLASANPFAGVIVTDWYSPPATPDERFKATAYVLGKSLTAENLKVSVFRQVMQNGGWTAASVDPATVSGIEDRILARAAQLKGAGQQNG